MILSCWQCRTGNHKLCLPRAWPWGYCWLTSACWGQQHSRGRIERGSLGQKLTSNKPLYFICVGKLKTLSIFMDTHLAWKYEFCQSFRYPAEQEVSLWKYFLKYQWKQFHQWLNWVQQEVSFNRISRSGFFKGKWIFSWRDNLKFCSRRNE